MYLFSDGKKRKIVSWGRCKVKEKTWRTCFTANCFGNQRVFILRWQKAKDWGGVKLKEKNVTHRKMFWQATCSLFSVVCSPVAESRWRWSGARGKCGTCVSIARADCDCTDRSRACHSQFVDTLCTAPPWLWVCVWRWGGGGGVGGGVAWQGRPSLSYSFSVLSPLRGRYGHCQHLETEKLLHTHTHTRTHARTRTRVFINSVLFKCLCVWVLF